MRSSKKDIYLFGIGSFLIFGIIVMSYGVVMGFLEGLENQFLWVPVFISPLLAFIVSIFVPKYSRSLKHSFVIVFIGSIIYLILAHFVGTSLGVMLSRDISYREMVNEVGSYLFISVPVIALIGSVLIGILGTSLSPIKTKKEVEKSEVDLPTPSEEPPVPESPAPSAPPAEEEVPYLDSDSVSPDESAEEEIKEAGESEGEICPDCGQPLAWIDAQEDWYCYDCEEYKLGYEGSEEAEESEGEICPDCGRELIWVDQYERWYCEACEDYKQKEEKTEEITCPDCERGLSWVEEYDRWYCYYCEEYKEIEEYEEEEVEEAEEVEEEEKEEEEEEEEEEVKECPDCAGELRWLEEYERWYCDECKEYKSVEDESSE